MKRFAFKLLVFVLAGAIINVAVAWGCTAWSRHTVAFYLAMRSPHSPEPQWFKVYVTSGFGVKRHYFDGTLPATTAPDSNGQVRQNQGQIRDMPLLDTAPTTHWSRLGVVSDFNPDYSISVQDESVSGWPAYSLIDWVEFHKERGISKRIMSARLESSRLTLSLLPIWPGFAINTIFYAVIVWMLFTVPGAVRRRVRIRRGQCASCGYSLRGRGTTSEKCPECGATA